MMVSAMVIGFVLGAALTLSVVLGVKVVKRMGGHR